MSDLPPYDDGYSENVPRAIQPWDHGPILTVRRYPVPLVRAWCVTCVRWVGPERTGDLHALRLVEDDAAAHAHQVGARCGLCEACVPDGASRNDRLRRAFEDEYNRTGAVL